jgi:hypothetical protein
LPNATLGRWLRGRRVRVGVEQVQARGVKGTVSTAERLGTIYARVEKIE